MASGVTVRDVAIAAGVSTATVSRALTGKGRIAEETTVRVRRIAEALGYQVNSIGRALREGTARTVGMVVPVIANPFYSALIRAVEDALHAEDLELLIADSHGDVEREARRLRLLTGRQVEAILVAPSSMIRSAAVIEHVMRTTPVVCLDRRVSGPSTDFVGVDNEEGMSLVLRHLVEQGVRSVAIAGSDNETSVGRERNASFNRIAGEYSLEIHDPVHHAFDIETGKTAGDIIGRRSALPDAIVAGDDLIAIGLISSLRRQGILVPRDVLVTGFDGIFLADVLEPGLTTVEQPIQALAAAAVDALLTRSREGTREPQEVRLKPRLVARGSTSRRPDRA